MNKKYLRFIRTCILSAISMLIIGAVAAFLTSKLTNSKYIIAIASTLAGYIGMYSVFFPLQAHDNPDLYRSKGKFKWNVFITDQAKIVFGFAILDIAYLLGKPILVTLFLEHGISPVNSSLYSDFIFYFVLAISTWPIAKLSGALRKK